MVNLVPADLGFGALTSNHPKRPFARRPMRPADRACGAVAPLRRWLHVRN